jgi:paraquat-inducible protein B
MSETSGTPGPATPPPPREPEIPKAVPRKPGMRWLQPVWIIPFVAAVIGGWLVFQNLVERGPTIIIRFRTAEGIEAGKTRIKYKDVDIGIVKSIELDDDRKNVLVIADMVKQASQGLLVDDTRFWVVRPRFSGGRVSGLSTLLAGPHIGTDPGKSKVERRTFTGLESPPVVTSDLPGRQFTLMAQELGSIDINSPLYFRGVLAGQVVSTEVDKDGKRVLVGIFVQAPFDQFVTSASRFWNASGIDLALDASGLRVDSQSLATILVGGIAFETPIEQLAAPRAAANATFVLWPDHGEAQKPRETVIETYAMTFEQSVRGLAVGAPVDFRGVVLGEVSAIELDYDPARVKFRTVVQIQFFPERLRSRSRDPSKLPDATTTPAQRMQRFVAAGFRGQLRSTNLLTGQLYVAIDFFPHAAPASIDFSRKPPEIPTVPGSLVELEESLGAIAKKLEKVPFDAIGEELRKALAGLRVTLQNVDKLATKLDTEVAPQLQKTLEQARMTLEAAERTVAADSPLQSDLRDTLQEVSRASEAVRALMDYLERQPDALIRGKREGTKP